MPDRPFFALAFPPSPGDLLALGTLLALLALVIALWATQSTGKRTDAWTALRTRARSPALLRVVLFVFALLLLLAIPATVWTLLTTLPLGLTSDTPGPTLGTGALLVALLGAPFLIWRSIVAQRTVDLAAETLLNDKLNAAATDLAARRQVTRAVEQDDKEVILTEWQDDLVTRAATIDRLEGLANEHPEVAPRVASLLSVYVRELSREFPAGDPPDWDDNPGQADDWWIFLEPARPDMEKAAQTLGRLRRIRSVDLTRLHIDLRSANLQGFSLQALDFEKADFSYARMEGTKLWKARLRNSTLSSANLRNASLWGASLEGARLDNANLEDAKLWNAVLFGADLFAANLHGAHMQGANLRKANVSFAQLIEADLIEARMEGAILKGIQMEGTELTGVTLGGAALSCLSLSNVPMSQDQVNVTFGDASVTLPVGFSRPAHWPRRELSPSDFETEWRKWQANPATYTPPD